MNKQKLLNKKVCSAGDLNQNIKVVRVKDLKEELESFSKYIRLSMKEGQREFVDNYMDILMEMNLRFGSFNEKQGEQNGR